MAKVDWRKIGLAVFTGGVGNVIASSDENKTVEDVYAVRQENASRDEAIIGQSAQFSSGGLKTGKSGVSPILIGILILGIVVLVYFLVKRLKKK